MAEADPAWHFRMGRAWPKEDMAAGVRGNGSSESGGWVGLGGHFKVTGRQHPLLRVALCTICTSDGTDNGN